MNLNPGRRKFFGMAIKSASRTLGIIMETLGDKGHEPEKIMPAIMSDLTPELMAMEAERLGLDPKKDKNRVLESIQAAMGRPYT